MLYTAIAAIVLVLVPFLYYHFKADKEKRLTDSVKIATDEANREKRMIIERIKNAKPEQKKELLYQVLAYAEKYEGKITPGDLQNNTTFLKIYFDVYFS